MLEGVGNGRRWSADVGNSNLNEISVGLAACKRFKVVLWAIVYAEFNTDLEFDIELDNRGHLKGNFK